MFYVITIAESQEFGLAEIASQIGDTGVAFIHHEPAEEAEELDTFIFRVERDEMMVVGEHDMLHDLFTLDVPNAPVVDVSELP